MAEEKNAETMGSRVGEIEVERLKAERLELDGILGNVTGQVERLASKVEGTQPAPVPAALWREQRARRRARMLGFIEDLEPIEWAQPGWPGPGLMREEGAPTYFCETPWATAALAVVSNGDESFWTHWVKSDCSAEARVGYADSFSEALEALEEQVWDAFAEQFGADAAIERRKASLTAECMDLERHIEEARVQIASLTEQLDARAGGLAPQPDRLAAPPARKKPGPKNREAQARKKAAPTQARTPGRAGKARG